MTAVSAAGLHVIERPGTTGLPLVACVHGAMDRGTSFGRTLRALRGLGDGPTLTYDRRGYGHSSEVPVAGFDAQVADLLDVLAGRRAVLVGHSLGGVIALAAAARAPDQVRAVVAYEPPTPWVPWWPERSAGDAALRATSAPRPSPSGAEPVPGDGAERFLRAALGDRRWERLPAETRRQRRAEEPALIADLTSLRGDDAPFPIGDVVAPVTLAYGGEGQAHHRRATRELSDRLPTAVLTELAGAAHGAHLSHPRELAGLIDRARQVAG